MDFQELINRTDLTLPQIATYLEVTQRTLYRWLKNGAPGAAWRALEYRAGEHKDWPGFQFQKQKVITPAGYCIRAIEIDQIPWFARMHYTNGQASAEQRLKAKVQDAAKMDQLALETLKSEIMEVITNFNWSVDRYLSTCTNLPMDGRKRANAL